VSEARSTLHAPRSTPPDLVVFFGRGGESEPERLVSGAQRASVRQLVADARGVGVFRRIVLATNDHALAEELAGGCPGLVIVETGDAIDFGEQLRAIIRELDSAAVAYVGGGSAPLLDAAGLTRLVAAIEAPGRVAANNALSSDWVGFRPADAIERTEPIRTDNDLAWRLHHDAGLARVPIEQALATTLDIDTPTDLALLRRAPGVPPLLQRYLDEVVPDLHALPAIEALLTDPYRTLIIAGRVNVTILAAVERQVSFNKRLFIEERGMRASGRQARGEVRTLLAVLLSEVGPERFFATLADLGDGLIFDTRPLFAHLAPDLSAADRFASDLLRPDLIANPLVREFTAAARAARIPVVLGGHALVTGGLWLLATRARAAKERAER
jgi:CTP:molybdopterin cytidylyltransferase MocA